MDRKRLAALILTVGMFATVAGCKHGSMMTDRFHGGGMDGDCTCGGSPVGLLGGAGHYGSTGPVMMSPEMQVPGPTYPTQPYAGQQFVAPPPMVTPYNQSGGPLPKITVTPAPPSGPH